MNRPLLRICGTTALLAVVLVGAPAWAVSEPVHIRQIATEAFPTVSVTFSAAEGLSTHDVTVTEGGRPVQILSVRPLSPTGEAFDVVLAIDTSNSVKGESLAAAVGAAKAFVSKLPSKTAVGVLTFSGEQQVVQAITHNHNEVLAAIDSITSTQAGTHLFDGVVAASKMFHGKVQHNIILLTDGADVGSSGNLASAVAAASKSKAAVFTVGLGTHVSASVLQAMAARTGGTYSPAEQAELDKLYTHLAGQLSRQYLVLYHSDAAGGAQVTIGVKAGGASDSAFALMPRIPTLPTPKSSRFPGGFIGFAIILGLAFAAVFMVILSVIDGAARLRRDRELARRMGATTRPSGQWGNGEQPGESGTGWIPETVAGAAGRIAEIGGFAAALDTKLERAGLPIKSGEFVAITVTSTIFALVVGLLFRNPIIVLVLLVVGALAPRTFVSFKLNKRVDRLHEQLPDVLLIMASSLRAGHSFLQSLDMVAKEIGEPSAPEFSRVVAEVRLGRPINEAMNALADRVGTEEFKWAIMAVNVQREVGGNLAEILDTVAETVRERDAIHRQIKVLSGEGRMSIRILIALPVIVALLISLVNPVYMRLLWTTKAGWFFIVIGVCLMSIGIVWARKVVRIDV